MSKAETYLAGVALALILGWWWSAEQRAEGRREEREAQAVRVVKHLIDTLRVVDREYTHDSIPVYSTITEYKNRPETLTVVVHDTAVVYVEKAQADAAVNGCTSLLHSCDIRVALRDSIIAGKDRLIATLPKPPNFFEKWTPRIAAGAIGFTACRLAK
jgi:hypothetical protein